MTYILNFKRDEFYKTTKREAAVFQSLLKKFSGTVIPLDGQPLRGSVSFPYAVDRVFFEAELTDALRGFAYDFERPDDEK